MTQFQPRPLCRFRWTPEDALLSRITPRPGPGARRADEESGLAWRRMVLRRWSGLLPPLLPATRWGRAALLLLVLFALARSLMWASAQPGWLAPDEDYHWHYVEHLLI